ncbi:MAG TPA: hypothetical protein VFH03_23640 [Actinoplanes sp.]|nr:hypothetical protein [Actinoplanes sp.]
MDAPAHPPSRSSRPAYLDPTQRTEEGTAAAIYGLIVSTAVMAASHATTAVRAIIAVLVTLFTYWSAERYARIVAERIHQGHRPTWHSVRHQLTTGWEMITVTTLPLAVLVVTRLIGAKLSTALLSGMVCSTALLCVAGWRMGRGGQLTTAERLASAAFAGLFGIVLIVFKTLVH